ncbi:MAG TPA: hypothetical protein VGC65_11990 [Bacteroidia bacterium]|jgi:hypothetical protein
MKQIILLALTACSLSSCSFLIKKALGIKDPKIETYESINEYAKTLTIEPNELTFTKDSASYLELHNLFNGTLEILIFNKSKIYLPYKDDSIACNGPISLTLKNICNIESRHAPIRREINYDKLLHLLDDHNNALGALNDTTIDFIIFADFVKYFPKANTQHIIDWNRGFKEHNGHCNAKIIYVNLDYMESWGISEESIPRLRVTANSKN